MAGSASADGNKALDHIIGQKMSYFYPESSSKAMWRCDICGKTTTLRANMRNHVETHVEGAAQQCHLCSKTAKTRESLRVHIYNVHKIKKKESSVNIIDPLLK